MEGVIQFRAVCRENKELQGAASVCEALNPLRDFLMRQGWMGAELGRYGGLGFGNISVRVGTSGLCFWITASQIGKVQPLKASHLCLLHEVDARSNQVVYSGVRPPSSETMTHAAVYGASPETRCVVHVHAPRLWSSREKLAYPVTAEHITYGTPGMRDEVMNRIARAPAGVLVLGGHEDGLLVWGGSVDEAFERLLRLQNEVLRLED